MQPFFEGGGINKVPYGLGEIGEILACERALHLGDAREETRK